MWKIKLPRDQDILVSKKEADFVKEQLKSGEEDFIEISGQIIKRSQVMAIISAGDDSKETEKSQDRADAMEKWKEEEGRLTLETPEEKAERTINCKAKILYLCRTGKLEIPKEIYSRLKTVLIDYFKKNPKEGWASNEIYSSLLPPGRGGSKSEGLQSMGEIIKGQQ